MIGLEINAPASSWHTSTSIASPEVAIRKPILGLSTLLFSILTRVHVLPLIRLVMSVQVVPPSRVKLIVPVPVLRFT